jgi:hypothetical protein
MPTKKININVVFDSLEFVILRSFLQQHKDINYKAIMAFSVCIISNVINGTLLQVIDSYRRVSDDILVGFNGLLAADVADFALQYPDIKPHLLTWKGYGPTKNELAAKAKYDWILSVDSDEIASPELQQSLAAVQFKEINTVYCLLLVHRIGTERVRYGTFGASKELKKRLYNRKAVSWDTEKVHEALTFPKQVTFETLKGILYHHTAENTADIRAKNRKYALLSAENMLEKGKKYTSSKPYLSGLNAFMKQYILKKGFLDGRIGFLLARESALYAWWKYRFLQQLRQKRSS